MRYQIGDICVDVDRRVLTRDGVSIADVPYRVVGVLAALAAAEGRLVSRQSLQSAVWGETHVDLNSVSQAVRAARLLLEQMGQRPGSIETVPGRGYRLVGPVQAEDGSTAAVATVVGRRGMRRYAVATLLVVILALSAPELRPSPDRGAAPRDHVNIPAVLARVEERAATRTSDGLRGAAAEILAALTITEDDSRLLAEAAEIHHLIAFYEIDDPLTANAAAEDLAERALQRDPTLRQAWAVLASVRLDRDWDLAGAARDFRAALRGEPDDVLARHWTAWWLLAAGRTGEAAATVANAAKLAPLSPAVITARATFSYFAGDYRGAERDAVAALVITPDGYRPHLRLGVLHTVRGEETKAIAHLQRAHELAPDVPETIATLGHASAVFGRRLQAEAYLRMLDERSSAGERLGYHRAMVLHGLGRGDEAVEALLSARRHGALSLGLLRAEPRIAALRRDSRIARLIDAAAVTAQPTFFPDRPQ